MRFYERLITSLSMQHWHQIPWKAMHLLGTAGVRSDCTKSLASACQYKYTLCVEEAYEHWYSTKITLDIYYIYMYVCVFVCHIWPRVCTVCHSHKPEVLCLLMTFHRISLIAVICFDTHWTHVYFALKAEKQRWNTTDITVCGYQFNYYHIHAK